MTPENSSPGPNGHTQCVAFIDLLATSFYARTDKSLHHARLNNFRTSLLDNVAFLEPESKVYLFSDCAYCYSPDPVPLLKYLAEVRRDLHRDHIYLKGAVDLGSLSPDPILNGNEIITGTTFGPDVASVFAHQDSFKGAGLRISKEITAANPKAREMCIYSCFMPPSPSQIPERVQDLKYSPDEFSRLEIERLLVDCMRARATSKSGASYYITPLISMIKSADWAFDLDGQFADPAKAGARDIFLVIIEEDFTKRLGDIRGAALVLFALLNETYDVSPSGSVCEKVREHIVNKPSILEKLSTVPPEILTYANSRRFVESTIVWKKKKKEPTKKQSQANGQR